MILKIVTLIIKAITYGDDLNNSNSKTEVKNFKNFEN